MALTLTARANGRVRVRTGEGHPVANDSVGMSGWSVSRFEEELEGGGVEVGEEAVDSNLCLYGQRTGRLLFLLLSLSCTLVRSHLTPVLAMPLASSTGSRARSSSTCVAMPPPRPRGSMWVPSNPFACSTDERLSIDRGGQCEVA